MSAKGIRAGKAYVEIGADNDPLSKGLRAAERKVKAFAASVTAIGGDLLKLGGLISTPFVAGTKVFADFETQMAQVSTMLDEPEKHMDGFTAAIRDMSETMGESTETLAKGLYDILSAGVDPAKALDVLAVSSRAAKAGISDTAVAADAITTVLNAYGLSADRAGDVSDLLFTTVKAGKTTFGELAPTIGKVATLASTAGVSLDEMGAMLGTLTSTGIKTEEAITALSAIVSSFLKPAAEGAEVAAAVGVEMGLAALQTDGLHGTMKKLAGLGPDALAKIFPNVRAMKGILPALSNMEAFADAVRAMEDRAGSTDKAYDKMAGTLTTAFQRLMQTGKTTLSVIGEAISEPWKNFLVVITAALKAIRRVLQANGPLLRQIEQIAVATVAAGGAMVGLGVALTVVAGGLGVAATLISAMLTPLGMVATLVFSVGAGFAYMNDTVGKVTDFVSQKFKTMSAQIKSSWDLIVSSIERGDLAAAGTIAWNQFKLSFLDVTEGIIKEWLWWTREVKLIWADVVGGISGLWNDLWSEARKTWTKFATWMKVEFPNLTAQVASLWEQWKAGAEVMITAGMHITGALDDDVAMGEYRRVAEELAGKLDDIEKERTAPASEIEAKGQVALDKINQEQKRYQELIDKAHADRTAGALKSYKTDIDAINATIKATRETLERAKQDALLDEWIAGEPADIGDTITKPVIDLTQKIDTNIPAAIQKSMREVRGFFDTSTLNRQGFGTSSVDEKQLRVLEQINSGVKKTNDNLENGAKITFE